MGETNFTTLEAWKINHHLTLEIYKITKQFPNEEKFGLTDQLRRSTSSISANIAEGYGRYHYKDKIKFYYTARGSSNETANHLMVAKDLGYISLTHYQELMNITQRGAQLINGLIRSINNQINNT